MHPADPKHSGVAHAFRKVRVRRHADYVQVYEASRRHTSAHLSYFYRVRSEGGPARFGLTTPRALGNAVLRNRIRRRLRVAARAALLVLPAGADVVLHPRATAAAQEWPLLQAELTAVFTKIAGRIAAGADNTPQPRAPRGRRR